MLPKIVKLATSAKAAKISSINAVIIHKRNTFILSLVIRRFIRFSESDDVSVRVMLYARNSIYECGDINRDEIIVGHALPATISLNALPTQPVKINTYPYMNKFAKGIISNAFILALLRKIMNAMVNVFVSCVICLRFSANSLSRGFTERGIGTNNDTEIKIKREIIATKIHKGSLKIKASKYVNNRELRASPIEFTYTSFLDF